MLYKKSALFPRPPHKIINWSTLYRTLFCTPEANQTLPKHYYCNKKGKTPLFLLITYYVKLSHQRYIGNRKTMSTTQLSATELQSECRRGKKSLDPYMTVMSIAISNYFLVAESGFSRENTTGSIIEYCLLFMLVHIQQRKHCHGRLPTSGASV